MARGDAKRSSDIDLLIVGKSGRLFTVRFFATFWMSILGIKRSKDTKQNHAGKICLNYYLADDYLKIPTGRGEKIDRYCALNYSKAKYLEGDYRLFEKFIKANQQLFQKYHDLGCHPELDSGSRLSRFRIKSGMTFMGTRIIEKMLPGKSGDWVEAKLKSSQIRRIESDPITQKYPELIVYNDRELRFHPPKSVSSIK